MILAWPPTPENPFGCIMTWRTGDFEFQGRGANSYAIFASDGEGYVGMARVDLAEQMDAEGILITLEPAATLQIAYSGINSQGAYTITLDGFFVDSDTIPSGDLVELSVPPGRLKVVVSLGTEDQEQFVEIRAGEVKELRFTDE